MNPEALNRIRLLIAGAELAIETARKQIAQAIVAVEAAQDLMQESEEV